MKKTRIIHDVKFINILYQKIDVLKLNPVGRLAGIEYTFLQKIFEVELKSCHGILLTPGFGTRGVEGMIHSAIFAMDQKVPYLGICFGAQLFYVAFMRHVLGIIEAH